MGHFNEQYITDCDSRTSDDDELDRRDGVSSKPALPNFDKQIIFDRYTRDFRMLLDGNFVGYAPNYHDAEITLDQVAYDMLIHGDFATATELDGGAGDPPDGPPIIIIEAPDEDPGEWRAAAPQAVTLTSIAIDQAAQRNRICANCGEPHYTWACPEVARASTPMTAVELGASLCGMLWCDPAGFVRLLTRSTPARRAAYAAAYIAFLHSERGWCDMTIADVLARWLPTDRGPAAPAMQVAA